MAKAKVDEKQIALISNNPDIAKPRLSKLIIKNYRCIGSNPVEIDLNDIVVLVGANNVGKSSILKAYELAMSQGSKDADLKIEDFPNGEVDGSNLPEIELYTIVYDNTPGEKWIDEINGEKVVRERWIWANPGKPKREGWDVQAKNWSANVPWGAPNVANTRRPEPHKVDAFSLPEEQTIAIKKLLIQALNDKVKNLSEEEGDNDYHKLIDQAKALQRKIVEESQGQIDEINSSLTFLIDKVFPGYKVAFDAKPDEDLEKNINFFKGDTQLLMGPTDGHQSTIERQGSGARRTLLWVALKYISENNKKKDKDDNRPHLLLLDEPEICLHPNAIREASNVLYSLPKTGNWQVMVTTHSPIFIDFSKDNTTIIKVEKIKDGNIQSTTVFRPDRIDFDNDDRSNLKLLNICDPYMAEFLFGGKVIVVEGDTEYTAFNYIKRKMPEKYGNINILRARGKATIVSLIKILNHFGSNYAVLHDTDRPIIESSKRGQINNPAWGNNINILNEIQKKPCETNTRLVASLPNFEMAHFGDEAKLEKPYNALKKIETKQELFDIIEALLNSLTDFDQPLPKNCIEWNDIKELENIVNQLPN